MKNENIVKFIKAQRLRLRMGHSELMSEDRIPEMTYEAAFLREEEGD